MIKPKVFIACDTTDLNKVKKISFHFGGTISNTTADVNLPIQAWMADDLEPNPISSLGILQFSVPPVIGGVIDAGPADKGGLRAGDTVVSVNGR